MLIIGAVVQCLMQLHPPLRKNDLKEDKILGKILDVLSNISSSKVCKPLNVFLLTYLLCYLRVILIKMMIFCEVGISTRKVQWFIVNGEGC